MNLIEEAVTDYWGARCPDFDDECATCVAWAQVDSLKDKKPIIVDDLWRALKEACCGDPAKAKRIILLEENIFKKVIRKVFNED